MQPHERSAQHLHRAGERQVRLGDIGREYLLGRGVHRVGDQPRAGLDAVQRPAGQRRAQILYSVGELVSGGDPG